MKSPTIILSLAVLAVLFAKGSPPRGAHGWEMLPTAHAANTPSNVPSPTQPGQPANCTNWAYARPADQCTDIIKRYQSSKLTLAKLIQYNPALKDDCRGIKGGYYLCIEVAPKKAGP